MLEAMVPIRPDNVRGLQRSEFEQLVELGVFQEDRVELLEGQLVQMSPQGEAHSSITRHLADLLYRGLPDSMMLQQHSSFRAGERSMPEPDLAVIPRRRGFHHPTEAFLIVEVADTSIHNDRSVKTQIYARAMIPEYWIVNVARGEIEVFSEPGPDGYGRSRVVGRGAVLRPALLPSIVLDVSAIFDC